MSIVKLQKWIIDLESNRNKESNSWDCLMAGHTIKTSTIDTAKETTNIGSIFGKMYIKRSISITTNCVNRSISKIFHYGTTCP